MKNLHWVWASALALVLPAADAVAQAEEPIDEVVVTGIRGSLKQSLDVKRDASQVVDAISAEDVGKFPDTNVAEALQRITGVAIDRSGGEGQFITVRGLGPEFNFVTLNGRQIATDNAGREFSFDVLASDIIQRAEVYKTSSADLPSGGIGANVNVVTARPFDRPGTSFNVSAAGIFDQLRDKASPDVTGVASWTNDDTTLGFLLGASYSDRKSQRDRALTNGFAERTGATIVDAPETSTGLGAGAIGGLASGRVQQQAIFSRDIQDRERLTINGSAQFSPNDRMTISLDALFSELDIQSTDTQFSGFFSPPFIDPVVDANGTVVSFSRPGVDFQGRNPAIAGQVGLSQNDNVLTSNNRVADTSLIGLNFDWSVTDTLTLNFDASVSEATRDGTNPFVVIGALAPTSPLIQLPNDDGITTITNLAGLTDTSIQRLHFVNVNRTEVDDDIVEAKITGDWLVARGPLQAIGFGFNMVKRDKNQNVFDNFAPTQGGNIFCAYCGYNVAADPSILSPFSFGGFLSGVSGADQVPNQILQFSFADAFTALNSDANINNPERFGAGNVLTPAQAAINADLIARRNAAGNSIYGFYTPELNPGASFGVEEDTTSLFLNTEWEGDFDGQLPWSAEIGFRIVETETVSVGVDQPVVAFRESAGDTQLEIDFGPTAPLEVRNDYINFLPSLNIKVEPTDESILRFSYSESVTRPTLTALGVNNTFGGRSKCADQWRR